MPRTIIIGDVHGCRDELNELLQLVEYRHGLDVLISVGDLVDRGPDSAGVVRRMCALNAICVRGNHESKHLRFRAQQAAGNVRVQLHHQNVQREIDDADWAWIASWPLYYRLSPTLVVVHAGLQRGIAVEAQEERVLTMMRYAARDTGKMASMKLKDNEMLRPATSAFWTELWLGPESVVYGHHIVGRAPAIDEPQPGVFCYGIDTGCYTGKCLTAAVFEDLAQPPQFVQVNAKHVWGTQYNDRAIEE